MKPNDIFRVPVMWLMEDSRVDVSIRTEREGVDDADQDLLELFQNIQSLFKGTASETHVDHGLKSRRVELNDDYYASVDIQGYKCLPEVSKDTNPLQYVLGFNPPLTLSNLCFSTMEVIEIDNPMTPDAKEKC